MSDDNKIIDMNGHNDHELSELYHSADKLEPSAKLDESIRLAARESTQWPPIATAAAQPDESSFRPTARKSARRSRAHVRKSTKQSRSHVPQWLSGIAASIIVGILVIRLYPVAINDLEPTKTFDIPEKEDADRQIEQLLDQAKKQQPLTRSMSQPSMSKGRAIQDSEPDAPGSQAVQKKKEIPSASINTYSEADFVRGEALVLIKIAKDIEALKRDYPQLTEFQAPRSFKDNHFEFSYAYNTDRAPETGGWSSGVPQPKDNGVWFYISIHPRDSTRQIHTQPVYPRASIGGYTFQFLIKEGKNTKSINSEFWNIFKKNGVKAQ